MSQGLETAARGRSGRGWGRWVAIAAGLVLLALIVVLAASVFSAHRVLVWGLTRLTDRVLASLPPGTPAAVRQELQKKFACVLAAARHESVDERRLGEFARACSDALADRHVEPDEMERLDAMAGKLCREAGGATP